MPEVADVLMGMAEAESPQKLAFFKHAESVTNSNPPAPATIPWAIGSVAVDAAYQRQYDEIRYGQKTMDQMIDDFFVEAGKLLDR